MLNQYTSNVKPVLEFLKSFKGNLANTIASLKKTEKQELSFTPTLQDPCTDGKILTWTS